MIEYIIAISTGCVIGWIITLICFRWHVEIQSESGKGTEIGGKVYFFMTQDQIQNAVKAVILLEKSKEPELYVVPVIRECKGCDNAIQSGGGTSFYWWCDSGHWHGKPLENVETFANDTNCHDFKLKEN